MLKIPNRYRAYIAAVVRVALPTGPIPAIERHLGDLKAAIVYESAADLVRRSAGWAASGAPAAREAVTLEALYPKLITFIRSCL